MTHLLLFFTLELMYNVEFVLHERLKKTEQSRTGEHILLKKPDLAKAVSQSRTGKASADNDHIDTFGEPHLTFSILKALGTFGSSSDPH